MRVVQRRTDHAGVAAAERGHRVVQVGEAADARIQRGARGGVVGAGMAGDHDHAGRTQLADGLQRHAFGRERHHHHAAVLARDIGDIGGVGQAEQVGVVDALARRRQERAFQMDAENAGYAFGDRRVHCFQRGMHDFGGIGDQRRQHAGGAEPAVRRGDAAQRVHRRRGIEQQPAAAVDLHVDEAGQQQAALQVVARGLVQRRIAGRHQRLDAPAAHQHGEIVARAVVGEDAAVDQGQ